MLLAGAVLAVLGAVFLLLARFPFAGRLPGDLHVQGRNVTFSFPITTCIIASIILTVVLNVILRIFRR
jgi:hypothetical protein